MLARMYRVGLTGGIASGKSAVGELLRDKGAVVLDADAIARNVVERGTPALADIVDRFGADVAPGGVLDRKALGAIVFADPAARADLNAIVHPRVREVAAELESQVRDPYAIVVHMIPLLVETGQHGDVDAVVVVDVSEETQLARLMERDGAGEADARARIAAQATRAQRLAVADVVINNDGTRAELVERTDAAWRVLHGLQHGELDCCY